SAAHALACVDKRRARPHRGLTVLAGTREGGERRESYTQLLSLREIQEAEEEEVDEVEGEELPPPPPPLPEPDPSSRRQSLPSSTSSQPQQQQPCPTMYALFTSYESSYSRLCDLVVSQSYYKKDFGHLLYAN